MNMEDKIKNAAQDAKGKVNEAVGDARGNEQQRQEGKADQTKADLKNAGENVKDAFKN